MNIAIFNAAKHYQYEIDRLIELRSEVVRKKAPEGITQIMWSFLVAHECKTYEHEIEKFQKEFDRL